MIVVGAYARIDPTEPQAVRRRLESLAGVETFDLDDPLRVGLIIQAPSLEDAHEQIQHVLPTVEGVLGVWPIFVGDDTGRWASSATSQESTPPAATTVSHNSGVEGV